MSLQNAAHAGANWPVEFPGWDYLVPESVRFTGLMAHRNLRNFHHVLAMRDSLFRLPRLKKYRDPSRNQHSTTNSNARHIGQPWDPSSSSRTFEEGRLLLLDLWMNR